MRHLHTRTLALLVAGLLAAPAAALAQVCVGSPARSGGTALGASIGFPEGAKTYGAGLRYNAFGPASLGVGYSMTAAENVDPKVHGVNADLAFELPLVGVSACPMVGAGFSRFAPADGESTTILTVPVGLGFGYRIPAGPRMAVIAHAAPQFLWARVTVKSELLGIDSSTDSETQFAALGGLTFQFQQLFVNGGVTKVFSEDDSGESPDPVFSLGLGVLF